MKAFHKVNQISEQPYETGTVTLSNWQMGKLKNKRLRNLLMVSNPKQSVCCDYTPIIISLKSHYISQ